MSSSTNMPAAVSEAIKKLEASDQVAVQTYIAKLKSTIEDLESEIRSLKDDDPHAHYHGHDKCTSDHGHSGGEEHHGEEEKGKAGEHDHDGHDHDDGHAHEHGHTHDKSNDSDDDIPAWKKKAMESGADDPMAAPFGGSWNAEASVDATAGGDEKMEEAEEESGGEPPFPPMYESGDDFEKAADLKMEASDLKSAGDYAGALEKYTAAVQAAEPSPLLYANRADCLLRLGRPRASVRDCDAALAVNPDSAKALRIRGRARRALGEFEGSLKDLSASQAIDYDDTAAEDLKFVTEKHVELEREQAKKRNEEEEKLRKRAEEIKKAQQEAKEEAERERRQRASASAGGMPGGMPGGGQMPAGMAGMMGAMMSDPEIAAGLQNPKVQQAFTELMSGPGGAAGLMSNPAKLQEMMSDPEVGPFMQKLMTKLGPAMGGMGGAGAGGGMGGMPGGGFSAAGAGGTSGAGKDDDDMPDLDDLPDLD